MPQTLEQFGQTIKAKYPQYNDIPDGELGQKMLTKYPQYQDMVTTESPAVYKEPTYLQKVGGAVNQRLDLYSNLAKGAAKGAMSTVGNVVTNVGQVTSGLGGGSGIEAAMSKSVGDLAESTRQLAIHARTITDPNRKADIEKQIGQNRVQLAQMQGTQAEVGSAINPFAEKPSFLQPKGGVQQFGFAAEKIAEFFVPGGASEAVIGAKNVAQIDSMLMNAVSKLPSGIARALTEGVARAVPQAITAGTISMAQTNDVSVAAKTAVTAGAISTIFGTLGSQAVKQSIGGGLKGSAEKSMSQALGATTKFNKNLSDKVVPGLLKRRVVFATRAGGLSKAEQGLENAGVQLEAGYSALPEASRVDIAPVIKHLEDLKSNIMINGTIMSGNASEYKALSSIQNDIINAAGGETSVSVGSLRKMRQLLDRPIAAAGKAFGFTQKESVGIASQKEGANAIRSELARQYPSIDILNKEYTFWKNVETVLDATVQRTKSQGAGLGAVAAEIGGGAAGVARGLEPTGIVMTALTFKWLKQLFSSPVWKTTSGTMKSMLADAIMSKDPNKTAYVVKRIISGLVSQNASNQ